MKQLLILLMFTLCFSTMSNAITKDFDDGTPKIEQMVMYDSPTSLEVATPIMIVAPKGTIKPIVSDVAIKVIETSIPTTSIYDVGSIYLPNKNKRSNYSLTEWRVRRVRTLC